MEAIFRMCLLLQLGIWKFKKKMYAEYGFKILLDQQLCLNSKSNGKTERIRDVLFLT